MRPDLEQYYLIDRYLANELNADERLSFELRMHQDASFAKEVSEQKTLNNIILEVELKSVREQMVHDLPKITDRSFFEKSWKWFGIGTLVLAGITYYMLPAKETTDKIIKKIVVGNNTFPVINKDLSSNVEKKSISKKNTDDTNNSVAVATVTNIDILKTNTPQKDTASSIPLTPIKSEQVIIQANSEHNQSIEVKKIDCAKTPIVFNVQTQATCTNEEAGRITIDGVEGGSKPYKYTLNESTSNKTYYTDLGSGEYIIKITDKNGCSSEKTATIKEKNCIQQITKFNINPSIGEVCTIPFAKNKSGNLTIYSRSGIVIYKVTNYSDDKIEWNGTDGHGALAEPGHYVYIIEYTDGIKESGEVNISR